MPAAPSSLTPAPWAADSAAFALSAPVVDHRWTLTAATNQGGDPPVSLTAWDLDLDIDATRIPLAELRFKMAAAGLDPAPGILAPWADTILILRAGWQRTTGPDLWPIFIGTPTHVEIEGGIATVRAQTMDGVLDAPRRGSAYTVPSTYTSVAQVIDQLSSWLVAHSIIRTIEGTLPTPTSGQLAGFRSMTIAEGGSHAEALVQMGNALGCWVRGSLRTPTTGLPSWLTISPRYDTGTPIDITPIADPTTTRTVYSLDDWAQVVDLTATWTEGKLTKTSQAAYLTSRTLKLGFEFNQARPIQVRYRPAGGVLTDTDPLGLAYANAAAGRLWRTTTTARSLWWLQPRQAVIIAGVTGQIEQIRHAVDAGTMTITTAPY